MGCDMVVALDRATAHGRTLFGQNTGRPVPERLRLQRTPARSYAPGESVNTGLVEVAQCRATLAVLGTQTAGMWGYFNGINEKHVAIGCANVRTKLGDGKKGLRATDLVRLGLERAACARQAVDLITDLLARHGQAAGNGGPDTNGTFLIADGREAFALETCGRYWVLQEVREVRAMSDYCTIRQDWNRIASGLAGQAIERGWWPEDGSKLDFAGALACPGETTTSSLRRWGRATFLLQEQNGHIDLAFLRELLGDHGDEADPMPASRASLCEHPRSAGGTRTAVSLAAELDPTGQALALAWCGFGPPCLGAFYPILPAGSLPEPFVDGGLALLAESLWTIAGDQQSAEGRERLLAAREQTARLQEQLDLQASDFQHDAAELGCRGDVGELQRQATLFHQHALESFEKMMEDLMGERYVPPPAVVAW
jgi:secernin